MHHVHLDRYAGLASPVHAIDARAKLAATVAFLFLTVLTPDGWFWSYAISGILVWAVVALSRVPKGYILRRALTVLPFALAVSIFVPFITPGRTVLELPLPWFTAQMTAEGLARFASLGCKVLLSFFATITLAATTPFGELLKAAGDLGLPAKMVVVLSFMYRYIFLVADEVSHLMLARDLRGGGGKSLMRASGGIIGALLIRSFEHADMLHRAMLLRGYTGAPVSLREPHLTRHDIVWAASFLAIAAAGLVAGGVFSA